MALVEEYYELNEAEEVSAIWKGMQIAFYISAACLGLWCGYTIALLRLKFEDKCYLFTSMTVPSSNNGKIHPSEVIWESDSWCDYCQYSMVSSFIVATIWATFFLMCGKGGKSSTGLPQPWRIVWPSLIFNLIYFVVALTTAVNIQQGTDLFCMHSEFTKKIGNDSLTEKCPPLKLLAVKDVYIASLQLDIVTKTSWGCVLSWLVLCFISLARIIFVIDFNMYKICVFKIGEIIQNKREEVLKITNYEDSKKINFVNERNPLPHVIQFEKKTEDKTGKDKINKKMVPIEPNAAFYVATDLRLLSREKQRKKSFKLLDQAFEKNKTNLGVQQMRQCKLDDAGNGLLSCRQYDILDSTHSHREEILDSSNRIRRKDEAGSYDRESESDDMKKDNSMKFKKYI